ncbi:hypothetical protein [Ferruginibacter sp.]
MMKLIRYFIFCFLLITVFSSNAQTATVPFYKGAVKANREKTYTYIVNTSIIKNLSLPLTDETEADWQDAFYAMELIRYKQPWVNEKIKTAFDSIENRTVGFQRGLMEMLYALRIKDFKKAAFNFLSKTEDAKIFAMAAEYLLMCDRQPSTILEISTLGSKKIYNTKNDQEYAIISSLMERIVDITRKKTDFVLKKNLFDKNYLKGNVIVYSIQRKNRDFPGIVLVRDTNGNFVTYSKNIIFSVPQLARSINGLPGYLTNGNTPQGIFRMYGFDISKNGAIGPTENIQLTMPLETSIQHFLKDSTIIDSVWTLEWYKKLLPPGPTNYYPLYETYNASKAGRTEIIAHGTTVDTSFYRGQPYFPLTPTEGCLCTKEMWSATDGKRTISDQQKLVDAVKKAGGADGYLIVIEIDDQQKPVSINEILPYLKKTK